jgi:hypothetical protein
VVPVPESVGKGVAVESGRHIPEPLTKREFWVLWVPEWDKVARAPWQDGHMYPCEWAESKNVDPRRPFKDARMIAELPVREIDRTWSFPDDKPVPDRVEPAVLLPNSWENDPIAFVDFDDVRDPDDGAVPREVWDIIERLGGFVEVSQSGSGLHCWVRASLPDGKGKFMAELDSVGQIEIYDHGRMTGGTWRHVKGTPRDTIPDADDVIRDLINEYGDESDGRDIATSVVGNRSSQPRRSSGNRSPYYDIDVKEVADTGAFRQYRDDVRNPAPGKWQGPHPGHGGTSNSDVDSTNFNVDGDQWYCFAHDDGGGGLQLLATIEDVVSCGSSSKIFTDDKLLLKTCLHARDRVSWLSDETPPYAALRGVARLADLNMKDADEGILGSDTHRLAQKVFDGLSASEV